MEAAMMFQHKRDVNEEVMVLLNTPEYLHRRAVVSQRFPHLPGEVPAYAVYVFATGGHLWVNEKEIS